MGVAVLTLLVQLTFSDLEFAPTTALSHGQSLLMAGFGVPVIRVEP